MTCRRWSDGWATRRPFWTRSGRQAIVLSHGDGGLVAHAHGTDLPLTSYRHRVQEVAGCLADTGFKIYTTELRAPELHDETTSQGFVIASSPIA